jgi:hypothetical protein
LSQHQTLRGMQTRPIWKRLLSDLVVPMSCINYKTVHVLIVCVGV